MRTSRHRYLKIKSRLQTPTILTLILLAPTLVMAFWFTNTHLNGSLSALAAKASQEGVIETFMAIWEPILFGSTTAWTMIAVFAALQLALMRWMPGPDYIGPVSPKGNRPQYKANGLSSFALTLVLYFGASYAGLFPLTIIYDHFGELLGALNLFSILFCLFLLFKGIYAPSSSDAGSNNNMLLDFYWGTELYPRLLGWDVKMFTNCRFGMMGWPLIIISFAAAQERQYGLSDSMIIAVALQLIYIAKFFYWEPGYLSSLDIMHDRAGYYICWGCLVWVPGIYTSPTLYLVNHPNNLGAALSLLLFLCGTAAIAINYLADRQRQRVRRTYGNCTIWKRPPRLLYVKYHTEHGEEKENILLLSGWWGISRHFHYLAEVTAALCWTLPALFDNFLPYFYVCFLTILLVERAYRDDKRCADKYRDGWAVYCDHVPYKIIPYVL